MGIGAGGSLWYTTRHENVASILVRDFQEQPDVPPRAGPLPHARGHDVARERAWHGPRGVVRAHLLERTRLRAAPRDPRRRAHSLLHRDHRHVRDGRRPAHAGLPARAVPVAWHLHPADRRELHHPRPRRGVRLQERRGRLVGRRPNGVVLAILPAGGFITLGLLLALINHLGAVQARRHGAPPPLPINLDCRHCTMCPAGK